MKTIKTINNYKNGNHLNSKYMQDYKKTLPVLPKHLTQVLVGMMLGDACMYKISNHPLVKFEQGYKQSLFIYHLFDLFKDYCFMSKPGKRLQISGPLKGNIKSYWFKTFSHASFTDIWHIFYNNKDKVKHIKPGLINKHLTPLALTYWVMCDGSFNRKTGSIILHTQGFDYSENLLLTSELNYKFNLSSKVISHKHKYHVIYLSKQDTMVITNLIKPYIIPSMMYKLGNET